jgi:DNA modification methylase
MTLSRQSIGSNQSVSVTAPGPGMVGTLAYRTRLGEAWCGDSAALLEELADGSVNLVMTSPPFALRRQKEYGNKDQHEYIDWLAQFAALVHRKLRSDGSFVLDLGGAYQKGVPTRSLYNFRIPLRFCDDIGFFLAEDFYWYNPAKLPSPIEWVNKRKIRAKDAVNTVWWFSKSEWPKADITKVLAPYSERMKKLLKDPDSFYSPKLRPSGHDIGKGFGVDNGGALPSNLLQYPNTDSNGTYLRGCKAIGIKGHPARFPSKLPEFFIKYLTEPGDLVAESLGRRWRAYDLNPQYLAASALRFLDEDVPSDEMKAIFTNIINGLVVDVIPKQIAFSLDAAQ